MRLRLAIRRPMLVTGAFLALALPGAAHAATINVTTNADALNPGDGRCSLREAVRAANLGTASGPAAGECPAGGASDLIRVPAGDFPLTLGPAGEDAALGGDLDVIGELEVVGNGTSPGPSGTDITAEGDRIFDVRPGAVVTISSLRARNGDPPDGTHGTPATGGTGANGVGGPGAPGSDGGGILNEGTLTLANVVVANNAAGDGGAGGDGTGGDGSAGGNGGAGIAGDSGPAGDGGGIHSTGTLVIRDSVISDNFGGVGLTGGRALGGNGGNGSPGGNGGSSNGGDGGAGGIGGISVAGGSLTMTGTVVTDNTGGSGGQGGGTGNGRGGDGVAGGNGGDGGLAQAGKGGAGGAGGIGGAGSMTISMSAITANEAGDGGGVGGAATGAGGIGDGTGDGGNAGSAVGGTGGQGGPGGGINALGPLSITNSLVAGNSAGNGGRGGNARSAGAGDGSPAGSPGVGAGGSGGSGGAGGGIRAAGSVPTALNLTLDGNTAGAGGDGGEGATFSGTAFGGTGGNGGSGGNASIASATIGHLTLTGGTAGARGIGGPASIAPPGGTGTAGDPGSHGSGPGISAGGGGVTLRNSIASGTGCSGPVADGSHNIAFNAPGCPGAAVDPLLGPLADNGGPSQTRRLLAGSPALDNVPTTGANCPGTDQRGAVRPFGSGCDSGAFELAPPAAGTGQPQSVGSTTAAVTGTVTARGLPATYSFDFGETTAYGRVSSGSTSSPTPANVVVELAGLRPLTTYHYRLRVASPDGQATGQDASFTTLAAPLARSVLSALRVRPARFRVARRPTPRTLTRASAVRRGTRISYRLSLAATVRLSIQRGRNGVRVRRRGRTVCVAASARRYRQAPKRRRCTRYRTSGKLTRAGAPGLNRVRFTGRIGRRALRAGRYRVVAVAGNAAGRSAPRRKAFRIVASR